MEHGGLVFVASAIFADRNGRVYPGPILPDIQMNTRWATLAGAEDPAIDEALRWILDQPLCRGQ